MPETFNVVVVEDDNDLRKTLVYGLNSQGLNAKGVGSAKELNDVLAEGDVDIVCLDLGLPDEDGISVALRLQDHPTVGVIMVTARGMDDERILGLRCGADLYFVKPVNIMELAVAATNLGRRLKSQKNNHTPQSPWRYMPAKASIETPGGIVVKLTPNECILMDVLFSRLNKYVTKSELLLSLGHQDEVSFYPRLEMLVSRLRAKVAKLDPNHSIPIQARHAMGYSFVIDDHHNMP